MTASPALPALPQLALSAQVPRAETVLLLIDLINPLRFDGAENLAAPAVEAAVATAALKRELRGRGVPAVYVNDNFGDWTSDFRGLVAHCGRLKGAAASLVRQLAPEPGDLTVLKPRHSAFHATPLALLLGAIGARRLVLTGLATDLCVQISAMDAFQSGFELWVPADCTAAESPERKLAALAWMARALKCRTEPAFGVGAALSPAVAPRLPRARHAQAKRAPGRRQPPRRADQ